MLEEARLEGKVKYKEDRRVWKGCILGTKTTVKDQELSVVHTRLLPCFSEVHLWKHEEVSIFLNRGNKVENVILIY